MSLASPMLRPQLFVRSSILAPRFAMRTAFSIGSCRSTVGAFGVVFLIVVILALTALNFRYGRQCYDLM